MTIKSNKSTRITASLLYKKHEVLAVLSDRYRVSLPWLTRKVIFELLHRHEAASAQLALNFPAQTATENQ